MGATGIVNPNDGISLQHTGPGVFVVTVTSPGCAKGLNDPTATVTSPSPSNVPPPGAAPDLWIDANGGTAQFTVHTGWISGGSFTPADYGFNIQDSCIPSGSGR